MTRGAENQRREQEEGLNTEERGRRQRQVRHVRVIRRGKDGDGCEPVYRTIDDYRNPSLYVSVQFSDFFQRMYTYSGAILSVCPLTLWDRCTSKRTK